jgi:hypothetical protein
MARANPIGIEQLRISRGDRLNDEIEKIVKDVAVADEARREWVENQRKFTRQRFGIRRKRRMVPWPGASNLSIPLIDKAIRRWKPGVVRLVMEADPIAFFKPREGQNQDIEESEKAQVYYDWLFRWEMDALNEVVFLADILAHRGLSFMEIGWKYRTERQARIVDLGDMFPQGLPTDEEGELDITTIQQELAVQYDLIQGTDEAIMLQALQAIMNGEDRFKIVYRRVTDDRPEVLALDPIQVVLPARDVDVRNSRFVAVQHITTLDDLARFANDGMVEKEPARQVIDKLEERMERIDTSDTPASNVDTMTAHSGRVEERQALDDMIGVMQQYEDENNIEIWRIYCWLDINNDGEDERCILWFHPTTKTTLALKEFTYPFARWPLVQFDFEKTFSKRVYGSRGISQMLSPLQIETNKLHNARLDAITIQLAPMFLVRGAANVIRQFRFAPGTGFPVERPDDVTPLISDVRNLNEYLKEEQFTRLLGEDYVGIFDAALGSVTNPNSNRTATEIETVQANISGIFSLDATIWQKGWRDVHAMVFELAMELGPKQVWVRVTGQTEPMLINKADINKKYDIAPTGTPASTNKAIELARARELMQLLWNPLTLQTGLVKPQELLKFYIGAHDHARAQRIIVQDENQAADRQAILQAAQMAAEEAGANAPMGGDNQVRGQRAGTSARKVT